MCDARGRKQALFISTIIAFVGSALQAGAAAVPMFLVARWLTGYGVGTFRLLNNGKDLVFTRGTGNLVTLIPIMQAEISPPASRGFLVAQHGMAHLFLRSTGTKNWDRCRSRRWIYDCGLGRLRLLLCVQ